jgi:hypothetical protein
MYQTSEEFGNLIQQDSRTFYALLYFDGNTITDGISEITIEGGSNSEDDFSIGSAVSRYAKIKMTNPAKRIEGKEIIIKIGMMVGESNMFRWVITQQRSQRQMKVRLQSLRMTA